jgi:hypothetical protein
MSFAGIYLSTIVCVLALDRFGLLHSSGKSAWETFPPKETWLIFDVHESSVRLVLFSVFVLTPLLYNWRNFVKGLFSNLALRAAGLKKGSKKHEKFVEQAWLALHYTIITSLGYYVLRTKPWWPPYINAETKLAMFASSEERLKDQEDLGLQALYAIQLSFYLLELLSLLLIKERRVRSDALVYFFHHVYTVTLLAGSWLTLDHRIGSLVLILHDVADIFLPIGKVFTYSEKHAKDTQSALVYHIVQTSGIIFFVIFIITFAIPRIFLFGGLIYHAVYDLHWTTCCGVLAGAACGVCPAPLYMAGLVVVLGLLWPMHVFWFYLIVRMAAKVLSGAYQDVRSDDEGGEEVAPSKVKAS